MAYIIGDSGERVTLGETAMVRDTNKGKPRFDLLLPDGPSYDSQMLTRWARHMALGAEKYSARNWEQGEFPEAYERAKESAFRHFMQWYLGANDEEDHAAALFFNVTACEFYIWKDTHL
jgi:Domain of unknown function (DUF5664)